MELHGLVDRLGRTWPKNHGVKFTGTHGKLTCNAEMIQQVSTCFASGHTVGKNEAFIKRKL